MYGEVEDQREVEIREIPQTWFESYAKGVLSKAYVEGKGG